MEELFKVLSTKWPMLLQMFPVSVGRCDLAYKYNLLFALDGLVIQLQVSSQY